MDNHSVSHSHIFYIADPPIHIELQNEVFNISTLNRTKTSLVLGTTASETRGNCSSAVKCLNSFDHPQQINEACEKDYDIHKNDNPIRDSLMNNPIFTEASAVRTSGSKVFLFDTTAITSEQLIGYMFGGFKLHLDPSKIRVADTLSQLLINFIQYDNPTPFGAENETVWQPLKKPIGFNFLAVDFNGIFNEPFYHYQSVMFWQAVAPIVDFVITKTEADELALHKQRLTALWVTIGVLIGALVFSTVPICILKCVTDRRKRLEDQDFLVDSSDRISLLCHRSCYANYGTSDVSEPLNIERLHK